MDFTKELSRKLTDDEWQLCAYYVQKAQAYYNEEHWSKARESLLDAVFSPRQSRLYTGISLQDC